MCAVRECVKFCKLEAATAVKMLNLFLKSIVLWFCTVADAYFLANPIFSASLNYKILYSYTQISYQFPICFILPTKKILQANLCDGWTFNFKLCCCTLMQFFMNIFFCSLLSNRLLKEHIMDDEYQVCSNWFIRMQNGRLVGENLAARRTFPIIWIIM